MSSLVVVSGKSRGYMFPLKERTIRIGREEGCDIQIVDEMVSREHMELRYDDPGDFFEAIDLESANGVFVNDHKLGRPTRLRDGDLLMIGESKLLFTVKEFGDGDTALNYFKQRGEAARNTVISPPTPPGSEETSDAAGSAP